MGSKNNIGQCSEREIRWRRFSLKDVKRSRRDVARLQRFEQRSLVNQPTSGAIDDPCSLLHLCHSLCVNQMHGLAAERHVQRQKVGTRENLIQIVEQLNLER